VRAEALDDGNPGSSMGLFLRGSGKSGKERKRKKKGLPLLLLL
jgi:hypothetical protein